MPTASSGFAPDDFLDVGLPRTLSPLRAHRDHDRTNGDERPARAAHRGALIPGSGRISPPEVFSVTVALTPAFSASARICSVVFAMPPE